MIRLLLSMTPFLAPTDPALNERADEVCACHIQSDEIQKTIDQMIDIAAQSMLVGLAAPQIGVQKRIILVDPAATDTPTPDSTPQPPQIQAFVNPEILWKSDEATVGSEGCFFTSTIYGAVPRAKKIVVRSYDRNGDIAIQEFEGYTARIFQHEIDHLDGIRFPDCVQLDERWIYSLKS